MQGIEQCPEGLFAEGDSGFAEILGLALSQMVWYGSKSFALCSQSP
jgi:hypothetical protein